MKTIYFSTFTFFFLAGILCLFNLDTLNPMLKQLCPLVATLSWLFSLDFYNAFVSYEEREEDDYLIKSLMEFQIGFMATINGMISIQMIAISFNFDFSSWSIVIAFFVSAVISFYICALTAIPLDPDQDDYGVSNNVP